MKNQKPIFAGSCYRAAAMTRVVLPLLLLLACVCHAATDVNATVAPYVVVNCTNVNLGGSGEAPLGCAELLRQISAEVARQLEPLVRALNDDRGERHQAAAGGVAGTVPGPIANTYTNCEAIRQAGYTEGGLYYLDIDRPNYGRPPFEVHCDFEGDPAKGVTVLTHDSQREIVVKHQQNPGSYTHNISYVAPMQDIRHLVTTATACQQYIQYRCHGAVLFYTGGPYGWWVSWDGKKQNYWGGAQPGSGKCACGAQGNCDNNNPTCNCNNNDSVWRQDNGTLTDVTALPVTSLAFGDADAAAEVGYHFLGPLRCWH